MHPQLAREKFFDQHPLQSILRSSIDVRLPAQAHGSSGILVVDTNVFHFKQSFFFQKSVFLFQVGSLKGSIIGPLSFRITLASLHPPLCNSRMIKYADDVSLLPLFVVQNFLEK